MDRFAQARDFLYTHARLLERLLFAVKFQHADPSPVGRLIVAYQNPDGGLGNALEPDLRCPESQPLFVEVGLIAMRNAGIRDPKLASSFCRFLESVSGESGLVPMVLPSALESPHASHMQSISGPSLNPTASICGLLYYQGVDHPWLRRATQTCCELLLRDPPKEAHALLCAANLARHLPDARIASQIIEQIRSTLPEAAFFIPHAPVTTYGQTPLHFAPSPNAPLRGLFTDGQIEGHLADLLAKQQPDGGWPISWEAPGEAATSEYRGVWTLMALSTLVDYGLIPVQAAM